MPSIAEVVAGRVTMNAIREVELEDLIRRAPSRIDLRSVSDSFKETCVLITGAGGSIGAELARQMLAFHPRRLVLMGRGENSIFETLQSRSSWMSALALNSGGSSPTSGQTPCFTPRHTNTCRSWSDRPRKP